MKQLMTLVLTLLLGQTLLAQTGTLKGVIRDADSKETLIGATVVLVGTYKGVSCDINGNYEIKDIKPGDYSVKVSFIGYSDKQYNGITIKAGETKTLNVDLNLRSTVMDEVVIVGEKNIINLEDAASEVKITEEDIQNMAVRDVTDIVTMQAGVNKTPDGINIRGGRNYETQYLVDGISAQDPLSGTGFGVSVQSSSISDVSLITGGAGAEYGSGASGVVSTQIREGGEQFQIAGSWQRDNLGDWSMSAGETTLLQSRVNAGPSWNTDIIDLAIGGSIPWTKKKLRFFVSANAFMSDDYYRIQANQLHSSLFPDNDSVWAPRQNNKFANTIKLSYEFKPGTKLTLTNQHSIAINQSTRSLQIVGFDAVVRPGLQYDFALDPDAGNTYTHRSNLTVMNFQHYINNHWNIKVALGRLFTNLRADANGRPFRSATVDQIYDPESIVTDPIELYNPGSDQVYVLPGPGLVNNGGIAERWHDHYVQEYTGKIRASYFPNNKNHEFMFGWEHKEKEYQWADVFRPWVGAPIQINDSLSTPSISVGSSSEIWFARPTEGGFWLQDKITYKGISATLGLRYNYWAYGKELDAAVENDEVLLQDESRTTYQDETFKIFGKRWQNRLLPKLNVSFPVTENNVLYFNYGHSMQMPHPRFIYAGLDPDYLDRSPLATIGNPIIKPESTVSYEIGIKSQITKDLGVTVAAYNNDKYDYIVSGYAILEDQTGKLVSRKIYYNQDYARIVGVELGVTQRIAKYFKLFFNGSFQSARGKSNSARESELQIRQQGFVDNTKEQPLTWDRPWDLKLGVIMNTDTTMRLFGSKAFDHIRIYLATNYKSGFRYTPVELAGYNDFGRPIYQYQSDRPNSEIAKAWFWTDLKITKDFVLKNTKRQQALSLSFEVRNLFNNKNAYIVNPVTGDGYREGDDVPEDWRDPKYPDPQATGLPPDNPARWQAPTQIFYGLAFKF
ncbi:TonB-dependent receptor [bacterium SCSIO 12741]|nr:TonB-dependent receptor [bacterium SCSIO 12741]